MVTRRVHRRQMLLIECEEVTQIFEYTLGYCLAKYNIELHAIVLEGNHFHRVDTDADGIRSDFIRDLHSLLARQLNCHYKQFDSVWSDKPTNIVHNEDANDIIRRIYYSVWFLRTEGSFCPGHRTACPHLGRLAPTFDHLGPARFLLSPKYLPSKALIQRFHRNGY